MRLRSLVLTVLLIVGLAASGCVYSPGGYSPYSPVSQGDSSWEEMHADADQLPKRVPSWCTEGVTLNYDRTITATKSPNRPTRGADTFTASADCEEVYIGEY